MKQKDGYVIKYLHGTPYLLPYGQNIADYRQSARLNDSGIFLWNSLKNDITKDELLKKISLHYSSHEKDIEIIKKDLDSFITILDALGMLEYQYSYEIYRPLCHTLRIASLNIGLFGDENAFSEKLSPFYADNPDINNIRHDQKIEIISDGPYKDYNGKIIIRNKELTIISNGNIITFLFPMNTRLTEAHMTTDSRIVRLYAFKPYDEIAREEIFHAIRMVFLYAASKRGMYAIHSASIQYNNHALLFSGHSGMGKSTHTKLWNKILGTPFINGDLNLVGYENSEPVVYGIPWCGTSGIYSTSAYPLGGIVLLGQSPHNTIRDITDDEKQLRIMQRIISPAWTEEQLTANLEFAGRLTDSIPVIHYSCNMNSDAVYTLKKHIDNMI